MVCLRVISARKDNWGTDKDCSQREKAEPSYASEATLPLCHRPITTGPRAIIVITHHARATGYISKFWCALILHDLAKQPPLAVVCKFSALRRSIRSRDAGGMAVAGFGPAVCDDAVCDDTTPSAMSAFGLCAPIRYTIRMTMPGFRTRCRQPDAKSNAVHVSSFPSIQRQCRILDP